MKLKYRQDWILYKIPNVDEYTCNYEVHGQGSYNGKYHNFYASDRNEAMVEARGIVAHWIKE